MSRKHEKRRKTNKKVKFFLRFLYLDLAVVTAALAVIGLGVQLGVHDVVVDEAHDLEHGLQVLLHVGHLHIADGAAGGEGLELGFKGQLLKGVDLFRDMDMIGIRNISLVRNARDHAEPLLQALGEFIRRGLQRRAVEGEIDVGLGLPLGTGVVEMMHDVEREGRRGRVGVYLICQVSNAF